MNTASKSTGWIITCAATGINLLLGSLYAWSVFKKALVADWQWSNTVAALPYTVCAAVFAFMMIFAGRAQDKFGPRYVAMAGGIMFGIGLMTSGLSKNPTLMVITFGLIGGIGLGLCYSATTPCAIKWFHPSKKGLISGIVVSGVGLAPVYVAPLTSYFIGKYGIQNAFMILGIFALVSIVIFSMILRNPQAPVVANSAPTSGPRVSAVQDFTWQEMVRTKQFILLWTSYLLTATAGLMLIAHMASIAGTQAKWKAGFMLVIILSIFNALGRIVGGVLSDKVGRTTAMLIVFLVQAVNMFCFSFFTTIPTLAAGTAIAGLAYGSLFALFPAATADFFGVKNLGVNYGWVFSGWGVAGIIGPILGGLVVDKTGTYGLSYVIAGVLLVAGAVLVKTLKSPQRV